MPAPAPIVTIIRPQLTPEEREERMERVKKAVADLYIECVRRGIEWPAERKEKDR